MSKNRTGQWFVRARFSERWYGPVNDDHIGDDGQHRFKRSYIGKSGWLREKWITDGDYLRIPPKPDLPPGLTTRACRLPEKGEMYMDLYGRIRQAIGDYKDTGLDNLYGWRCWIVEAEPAAVEPVQEPPIEQIEAELAANGITGISFSAAGKLFKCIADMGEVVHWAQAVLTAWNSRPLAQECLLHKKLREVMIAYRRARAKSAAEPAPANPCVRKIVEDWLKEHNYDGLCNRDRECGCTTDDLMSCNAPHETDCQAGYAGKPNLGGDRMLYLTREAAEAAEKEQGDD